MASWSDGYWWSNDGLRLHYRDYAGDASRPPILCLPGLTRNARDFEGVAGRLAGDRRVICVELRGRGERLRQDPMTYVPLVYLQDLEALIAELGLERFVLFGTSLGGLMTMLLSMSGKGRIAGALLNDIGPALEPRGLEHIRSYVGKPQNWPTWLHAARFLREAQGDRYPDWELDDWLVFAKRVARLNSSGRIVFDYDMRIAEPFSPRRRDRLRPVERLCRPQRHPLAGRAWPPPGFEPQRHEAGGVVAAVLADRRGGVELQRRRAAEVQVHARGDAAVNIAAARAAATG